MCKLTIFVMDDDIEEDCLWNQMPTVATSLKVLSEASFFIVNGTKLPQQMIIIVKEETITRPVEGVND